MRTIVFANAFSTGMLFPQDVELEFLFRTTEEMRQLIALWKHDRVFWANAIRHKAIEELISERLGIALSKMERVEAVTLSTDMTLVVCVPRWKGGRPPETRDYSEGELKELARGLSFWVVRLAYQ